MQSQPYRYTLCLFEVDLFDAPKPRDMLLSMLSPLKLLSLGALGLSAFLQPASAALVASWDFSTGTSADLTSSNGLYSFASANFPEITYNVGSVTLSARAELVATGINSTSMPELTQSVTIWFRGKYDATPAANVGSFYAGLVSQNTPADWDQMSMVAFHYGGVNEGVYGRNAATNVDLGTTRPIAPTTDTYFTMALVFQAGVDANGNINPALSQMRFNLNGADYSSAGAVTSLPAFTALALGQLKASGGSGAAGLGVPFTFDEVQIYNTALTAAEIAAIPEPSSIALILGGSGLVAGLIFRRRG